MQRYAMRYLILCGLLVAAVLPSEASAQPALSEPATQISLRLGGGFASAGIGMHTGIGIRHGPFYVAGRYAVAELIGEQWDRSLLVGIGTFGRRGGALFGVGVGQTGGTVRTVDLCPLACREPTEKRMPTVAGLALEGEVYVIAYRRDRARFNVGLYGWGNANSTQPLYGLSVGLRIEGY